jgi:alkyl sulfatase BDS1-like metallo-beta-lactamase superfamily hydrolase
MILMSVFKGSGRGSPFRVERSQPFNARMTTPLAPTVRGAYTDGDMVITLFDDTAIARDGLPCRNISTRLAGGLRLPRRRRLHLGCRLDDRRQGRTARRRRDLYKYVHDQTLRLMNHGYTAPEIAEMLELPTSLGHEWCNRDYYGAVRHNVKAIYQKYLGWYDANPANLDPLPPAPQAKKYVEYMGGAAAILAKARKDYEAGEYRWVAEVTNRVVFAEPDNSEARALNAAAFEQLGYLSEAATWRNAYLFGAYELRHGVAKLHRKPVSPDVVSALPVDMFFDYLGVRVNGPKADGKTIVVNWRLSDTNQSYVLNLENSALTYVAGRLSDKADATVTLTRGALAKLMQGQTTLPEIASTKEVEIAGDRAKLIELFELFDTFDGSFPIVEPKSNTHR